MMNLELDRNKIKYLLDELYIPYSNRTNTTKLLVKLRTHLKKTIKKD